MGEICVHLDDIIGIEINRLFESCSIGGPQSFFVASMEDVHARIFIGELVREFSCAIGRMVVYDEDFECWIL